MSTAIAATVTIQQIQADEVLDYVTRPEHTGKYYAHDEKTGGYIAIDRTNPEGTRCDALPSLGDALAFLGEVAATAAGLGWSDEVPVTTQEDEAFDEIEARANAKAAAAYAQPPVGLALEPNGQSAPAEPVWMQEAMGQTSDEPEGEEVVVSEVVIDQAKEDQLLLCAQNVGRIEGEYFNRLRTFNDLEADLKRCMADFDTANAELINSKKSASAAKLQAETDLKQALCEWGGLSAEKTFDQYLSVMETSSYEIDEAEATTWAEANYPAALNRILNQKLIIDYVKKTKKILPFVKVTKQVAAKISRKV